MTVVNYLDAMHPTLGMRVGKLHLGNWPTPVSRAEILHAGTRHSLSIKRDDLSGDLYGGNKVRKLEYLLKPHTQRTVKRFATFGTVGSNHALATAIYARNLGFECTCFLAHQQNAATIAPALITHARIGTEIVRFGGSYSARLKTLRQNLWGRNAWVVPMGGSSWAGTLGFVNAGLELSAQIDAGKIPVPARLYVATGTMGTAAGLALGLALAGVPTEVHAVRVSETGICNERRLQALIRKTAMMMRHYDASVPDGLADNTKIRLRHAFFAGGYAHSDMRTEDAVRFARVQLGLTLESTYTGKAMAAVLSDWEQDSLRGESLFWNSYNSAVLPLSADNDVDRARIPAEFRRYLD
jgi:1-aminocyclopropane-1-carboxylate deaminase/D-cysteine desulfhydrase-like pyridoxal-dependent ACC family enzyme